MSTIFIFNMNIVEFSSHMFGLELIESLVLDRDLSELGGLNLLKFETI